jgi:hypothetical protein
VSRAGVAFAIAVVVSGAAACGVSIVGTGPDGVDTTSDGTLPEGGTADDAARDAAAGDASFDTTPASDASFDSPFDVVDATADGGCPPGAFRCSASGNCITSCLACKGATFECEATRACSPGCASCAGAAFECVTCAAGNLSVTGERCTPDDSTCYVGTKRCAGCKSAPCPGGYQSCVHVTGTDYECFGCGEANTDGQNCTNGGNCVASTFACE